MTSKHSSNKFLRKRRPSQATIMPTKLQRSIRARSRWTTRRRERMMSHLRSSGNRHRITHRTKLIIWSRSNMMWNRTKMIRRRRTTLRSYHCLIRWRRRSLRWMHGANTLCLVTRWVPGESQHRTYEGLYLRKKIILRVWNSRRWDQRVAWSEFQAGRVQTTFRPKSSMIKKCKLICLKLRTPATSVPSRSKAHLSVMLLTCREWWPSLQQSFRNWSRELTWVLTRKWCSFDSSNWTRNNWIRSYRYYNWTNRASKGVQYRKKRPH